MTTITPPPTGRARPIQRLAFTVLVLAALLALAPTALAERGAARSITRLDCGSGTIKDFDRDFADTHEYPPGPHPVAYNCYLIRHGDQYLLWGTGFTAAYKGRTIESARSILRVTHTVPELLAQLGLAPGDIDFVGASHMHGDHSGQVKDFPAATLVIGKADFDASVGESDPFGPWRGPGAKVLGLQGGDIDVFGDGSVVALKMPGHTAGHMALLVKLASGNVLLSGDLYHSRLGRELRIVGPGNASRADSLASMDRFERLAKSYAATVIIEHEPEDNARLPAFPDALR